MQTPIEQNPALADILSAWLNIWPTREHRQFLEHHLEVLCEQSEELLAGLIAQYAGQCAHQDYLGSRLRLLRDARRRGGGVSAVHEAYVDAYGGFVLDLPDWLDRVWQQLNEGHADAQGDRQRTAAARVKLLHAALVRAAKEPAGVPPEVVATLHTWLWDALDDDPRGRQQQRSQEEGIAALRAALRVYRLDRYPRRYAAAQNSLCLAYTNRLAGERRLNLEQAVACCREALRVYTYTAFPWDYAATQSNLGTAYLDREAGRLRTNLERAIACSLEALRVYTLEASPRNYAMVQHNLGAAYVNRVAGVQRDSLEQAIACYREALRVYRADDFPDEYAITQTNLGNALRKRLEGERRTNVEQALTCYHEALRIHTLDASPEEHRRTLLNQALAIGDLEDWPGLAETYRQVLDAEDLLVSLAGGIAGQEAALREGRGAARRGAFALVRCGRIGEAAVLLERGRARGMAAALALDVTDPRQISSPSWRRRYIKARNVLRLAQNWLNASLSVDMNSAQGRHLDDARRSALLEREAIFQEAKAIFDRVVAEIRMRKDPEDFLTAVLDERQILQAAQRYGLGHAVVYLLSTPWGGLGLAAFDANPAMQTEARFRALQLPALTDDLVNDLVEIRTPAAPTRPMSGFALAQEGTGFGVFLQNWSGATLRAKAAALQRDSAKAGIESTFDHAIQALLTVPECAGVADLPLDQLPADTSLLAVLDATFGHVLLRLELRRCLSRLSEHALRPLAQWLHAETATGATLIPCGTLAALPLLAAEVAPGKTLGELLPSSVAPSGQAMLHREVGQQSRRAGVYAVGDPRPTSQPLAWAEAEALSLARVARITGIRREAKVQEDARRDWLIKKLRTGQVVDMACHGAFDVAAPLDSTLRLAGDEVLTLRDVLSHAVDLCGLRLLVLSACQTAILDLRGAREEVRSLAAGMYQAGPKPCSQPCGPWRIDQRTY